MNDHACHQVLPLPQRFPVNGTFELTVRCNLHCQMCLFRHDDSENAEIKKHELTAQEWIKMAKEVAKEGTMTLLITGGEPLLRPDFCEIWEGIYQQGFLLTLYTNATLVTPKIMETLKKYPPHTIGVTIYGASANTYEKVCKDALAFEKAINGMHQLSTLPSKMEFRTTIIKDNFDDADAIEKLVHDEFGKDKHLTQTRTVNKAVRGACADVESCRLEPIDNVRLAYRRKINIIKEHIGEDYKEENVVLEYKEPTGEKRYAPEFTLFGCNTGMSSYTITWDGKLLACQMLGAFETEALKLGFKKAWEDYPKVVKIPPLNDKCVKCIDLKICNSCYASRYAETGDVGGCPEYACKDTAIISELIRKGTSRNGRN